MENIKIENTHQAEAILRMGQGVRHYNRGVLSMLGLGHLLDKWEFAEFRIQQQLKNRIVSEELFVEDDYSKVDMEELRSQEKRSFDAWKEIEKIRDQAREYLENSKNYEFYGANF